MSAEEIELRVQESLDEYTSGMAQFRLTKELLAGVIIPVRCLLRLLLLVYFLLFMPEELLDIPPAKPE